MLSYIRRQLSFNVIWIAGETLVREQERQDFVLIFYLVFFLLFLTSVSYYLKSHLDFVQPYQVS